MAGVLDMELYYTSKSNIPSPSKFNPMRNFPPILLQVYYLSDWMVDEEFVSHLEAVLYKKNVGSTKVSLQIMRLP